MNETIMSTPRSIDCGVRILVAGVIAALLAAWPQETHAWGETDWILAPPATGDWTDPANWNNPVPNSSLESHIDNGGTAVISSDVDTYRKVYIYNGTVRQIAGVHDTRDRLFVGGFGTDTGRYELMGGDLLGWIRTSANTSGTFRQEGGRVLATMIEICGGVGNAAYELVDGEVTVEERLRVGINGAALFQQTGGTVSASKFLLSDYLGQNGGGRYELHGGAFSAVESSIGINTARFEQTGGSHKAGLLDIDNRGVFAFSNGTLQIDEGFRLAGQVDLGHSNGVVDIPGGAIVDLSQGGTFMDVENASLHVGPESVVILPAGTSDPTAAFAHYTNAGITHTAGSNLVIPTDRTVRGRGGVDELVECNGALSAHTGGWIDLNTGLVVSDNAVVDLGEGTLTDTTSGSGMDSGTVSCLIHNVGSADGAATFTLEGGSFTSLTLTVGTHEPYTNDPLPGRFVQTAGTRACGWLRIGDRSTGTYELHGGELTIRDGHGAVGYSTDGDGTLIHTGGVLTSDDVLYVGGSVKCRGRYELSGTAELNAATVTIAHASYTSTLDQSGGVATISELLKVGSSSAGEGVYEMSGGSLTCPVEHIGPSGPGRFSQSDGSNNATELLVGHNRAGLYTISGGRLSAGVLKIGSLAGPGTFDIADAAADVTVSQELLLGANGTLVASAGATIHMTGSGWSNVCSNPAQLEGLTDLALMVEGGQSVTCSFEVAGSVDGGFVQNFALGRLVLGQARAGNLRLVDTFDNRVGNDECLFLHDLLIHEGATLDVNALRLYVHGNVESMLDAWIGGDNSGRLFDGTLAGSEYLDAVYDSTNDRTTLAVVPEPTSMLLLAGTASLALLHRRRRIGRKTCRRGIPRVARTERRSPTSGVPYGL